MSDVLLSYAREDEDTAKLLRNILSEREISVNAYSDILSDASSENVRNALFESKVLILLLSKHSQGSRWINEEVAQFLKDPGNKIIPVLLDDFGKENWVWPLVADRTTIAVVPTNLDKFANAVEALLLPKRRSDIPTSRTVAKWKSEKARDERVFSGDPVVGWLVAVEGPMMGQDFRIFNGINTIGRNQSNRIYVSEDHAISRETHVSIVYDSLANTFYLRPNETLRNVVHIRSGATTNLEYGEPVWEVVSGVTKLVGFSLIRIGASTFIFVPFCGESFKWVL